MKGAQIDSSAAYRKKGIPFFLQCEDRSLPKAALISGLIKFPPQEPLRLGSKNDRLKADVKEWEKKIARQSMRPHTLQLYRERESLAGSRQPLACFVGLSKKREDLPNTSQLVLEGQNPSSQRRENQDCGPTQWFNPSGGGPPGATWE